MKRARSCPGPEQTRSRAPSPKRLKLSLSRPARALPLTPETLAALSPSAPKDPTQSVQQWASNCDSYSEPEMGPPQTPSVTSNDSAPRRASKLSYRRQRSQSPSKKSSTQYRSRNMADASVFVDHFPDPPSDVRDQLERIFQVSVPEDIGQVCCGRDMSGASAIKDKIGELAEKYCHKSRQMAKDCAGEGQWKSYLLAGLMEPMQELWPDIVKLSASEKPWISELRPTPPSFDDMLGSGLPLPVPSEVPELPPSRDLVLGQTVILSPPSNPPSDFTTDDPNRISIPKPDISLGLSHSSFSRLHGRILWDLQDNSRVFSEPHQSGVGLHFPFLILEAKGLAAGSNLVGAQNQAAVDGACALNILRDLKLAAITHRPRASTDQPKPRQILFSVVTEGPVHELWVHYQIEEAYHMTMLRVWRTTIAKDAGEFVQALSKIFEWGVLDFRTGVLTELTVVESMLRERRGK